MNVTRYKSHFLIWLVALVAIMAIAALSFFPARNVTAQAQDLVGSWALDEVSGQRMDSSGLGNHLTDYHTVGSAPGQVGLAADLEFDNYEYLFIPDSAQDGLGIMGSLTLVGWMNPESLPGPWQIMVLASKYEWGTENRAYRFYLHSTRLGFVVSPDGRYDGDSNLLEANLPVPLSPGTWYHVAAVFDADQRTMFIYLDGDLIDSRPVSYDHIYNSSAPFMLGANVGPAWIKQRFDGLLDEWYVYARALSESEIEALMTPGPPQRTLTVNVVGDGSVTLDPAGGIYDDGTVVTLTPHADPGCSFGGWSGPDADDLNDNGDGTWSLTMDGDKTVTATFTQDEYTLMVNVVGDGAVSKDPDQATYHYGDEVQLTATAGVGSSFSGWSGDLGGNVNPETLTMDGDKIVTATFTPGQCPLTVNVLGHGSVTLDPAGGIYDDGTVVTLTPHADAGWSFDRWSGANAVELINNHDGTWSLIMDGPKDITAKFVHHIYMPYLTGVNYRHYHRYYLSVVLK